MTPSSVNVGKLISRHCARDKVAVINFDGVNAQEMTYGEIDDLADGVARALIEHSYARGDRIAILSANNSNYLAIHLGIMRAGLVSVPVNFRLGRELVNYIVQDCGARLVFCDTECHAILDNKVQAVNIDVVEEFNAFVDRGPFEATIPRKDEPSTFYYTSGSTGKPKGVVVSHNAQWWVVQTRLGLRNIEDERALVAAPLYHMNALALSHLILAGHASMVLMPKFDVKNYVDAISRFRCTWLTAVPPMIAMIFEDKEAVAHADFSSIKSLRMGSAPVSKELLNKIESIIPQAKVMNAYGTTEGSMIVFAQHPDGKPTPFQSLGYKHPAVDLRLVDGSGAEASEGVLQVRSPALMNEYHNRPELSAPFTGDGYYETGDIFRRDADGFYFFVGRADDMFVCGGESIFPGAVERLLEGHPDVAQACVVPIDDPVKGQKPVAFVQLESNATVDAETLKTYALENGPAYSHPRSIWFLEQFPLGPTNKIDRALLKQRARELGIGR